MSFLFVFHILTMKSSYTRFSCHIDLKGPTAGASNRFDLLSLVTSGVNSDEVNGPDEDILGVVEEWEDDEM